jgi:hypothetical protein
VADKPDRAAGHEKARSIPIVAWVRFVRSLHAEFYPQDPPPTVSQRRPA